MFIEYFLWCNQPTAPQVRGRVVVRTPELNEAYGTDSLFNDVEARLSESRMVVVVT